MQLGNGREGPEREGKGIGILVGTRGIHPYSIPRPKILALPQQAENVLCYTTPLATRRKSRYPLLPLRHAQSISKSSTKTEVVNCS